MNVELSCDLGEGETEDALATERAIWPLIGAANVACGGHAGDERSMLFASRTAARLGVTLGAHPSYPDRAGFGRTTMRIAPEELRRTLMDQIMVLRDIASPEGVDVRRVKPHGALYNDAHKRADLAELVLEAMQSVSPSLAIVAGGDSAMALAARARGVPVIREAFADRRYRDDGSLVPRNEPGALLSIEEASVQAGMLAGEGMVITQSGRRRAIAFDTICIHADMEGSLGRLQAIRRAVTS